MVCKGRAPRGSARNGGMVMKILVIGGVAAGTKAAAKLKREQPDAQVVLYTKGQDISYAGCGLPYYVGGSIETREELIVNTPWKYAGLTRVEVHTGQEATALDAGAKPSPCGTPPPARNRPRAMTS